MVPLSTEIYKIFQENMFLKSIICYLSWLLLDLVLDISILMMLFKLYVVPELLLLKVLKWCVFCSLLLLLVFDSVTPVREVRKSIVLVETYTLQSLETMLNSTCIVYTKANIKITINIYLIHIWSFVLSPVAKYNSLLL